MRTSAYSRQREERGMRAGPAMKRWTAMIVASLLAGCATSQPAGVRTYDFGSSLEAARLDARLDAPIAIPQVSAPSWLRGPALVYRLDYLAASRPQPYALSRWVAPPAELITLRLRERAAAVNTGFTLTGLDTDSGFRLEVTLEEFGQVFDSPSASHCIVQLRATLAEPSGGRVVAQRTFRAQSPAPSADAAGAVQGLIGATDAAIDQILLWVGPAVNTTQAARTASAGQHR